MQVLVSLRPFIGHLHPCLPLLHALRDAGHSVEIASAEQLAQPVRDAGFAWVNAGIHPGVAAKKFPNERSDYGRSTLEWKVRDLFQIMRLRRPDVLLRDPTDLAGAVAAEAMGVPAVTTSICHLIPLASWRKLAANPLTAMRQRYHLPPDPELGFLHGALYVDVTAPSLEIEEIAEVPQHAFVRYRVSDGGEGLASPAWLEDLPDRPTVLVTLGTVYSDRVRLREAFLAGLADEDLNVVCTLGAKGDRSSMGVQPANARIEQYVPHSLVLPRCAAMVCHGGFNTVMGAMCEGVPIVCTPIAGDQIYNARRCEELGLGIQISRAQVTPGGIRIAVRKLLDEPSFGMQVGKVRDEIAGLPDVATLVPRIEALARVSS